MALTGSSILKWYPYYINIVAVFSCVDYYVLHYITGSCCDFRHAYKQGWDIIPQMGSASYHCAFSCCMHGVRVFKLFLHAFYLASIPILVYTWDDNSRAATACHVRTNKVPTYLVSPADQNLASFRPQLSPSLQKYVHPRVSLEFSRFRPRPQKLMLSLLPKNRYSRLPL